MTDEAERSRIKQVLTWAGLAIGVATGASALLFTIKPDFAPCLEGDKASFTGAPVFPGVGFRDHLIRTGTSPAEAEAEPNIRGAEVRFSYETKGLRDQQLPVAWTLVRVERDGTLRAVDKAQDRNLAATIKPDGCSETGGTDLFVEIPRPGMRYRVVLELYRDAGMRDRLTLAQTAIFRG